MSEFHHIPVLAADVLEHLTFPEGQKVRMIDGTLGGGGHSSLLLEKYPDLELLGIDRDEMALENAEKKLAFAKGRFQLFHGEYARMKEFAAAAGEGMIVLHCYAGNADFLEKFLELGSYIGVTGMVTFPKSHNIRENLRHIPRSRLLFETDSPYLAPVPFRGKPNHPALVATVVEYAAKFLETDPETLAEETTGNAMKFFDLKEL